MTKQTDDEYATWVRDALKAIANQSAGSNAPERNHAEVMSTLERLLNPVVCRRLGIYDWPPDFLLSVVIPVFNEEATIATLIGRVLQVNVPCEIIVVDVEEAPDDPDARNGKRVVFRATAGFEPPTVEMVVEGAE